MAASEKVMIAVMGLTGTGKSSLIKAVTGIASIHVEDNLHSGTQQIQEYEFSYKDTTYVLVDTPGFDDSSKSDTVVVEELLCWLETTFRQGTKLNGIIYLHSILQPRMTGSALRNMTMFRKLCGPNCYQNVVLGTTFWDQLSSESIGEKREKELKQNPNFWGTMVSKGSPVIRLSQEKSTMFEAINLIRTKGSMVLQAQDELVKQGKVLAETAAAKVVQEQAKELEKERKKKIEEAKAAAEAQRVRREKENERKAKKERDRLAAKLKEEERKNREEQEEQKRRAREYEANARKAREQAAKEERERVTREAARIKAENEAQMEAQIQAQRNAALRRALYYRNFRCARITPRGNCDRCGTPLSLWKYYFHCCHCFYTDNYWQCGPCGAHCKNDEHPLMRRGEIDDCIVM